MPGTLVGIETGDDAGVFIAAPGVALVQTLDFFTPIVDDPYLFGQIAATNSLSDVYAMGGRPLTAMNIVCFPLKERGPDELAEILRGGAEKMAEAHVALVGGHSVDDPEPKYGLSVTGIVDEHQITTNAGARPGDVIVLTKPIGTGIITTGRKFDECPDAHFTAAVDGMRTLNANAAEAMRACGIGEERPVHAATDITGFGLLGHLFQMAKASSVSIRIDSSAVPLYPGVMEQITRKNITAGGRANLAFVGEQLSVDGCVTADTMDALSDPQTSGGVAICVQAQHAGALIEKLATLGTLCQAIIAEVTAPQSARLVVY
jgi:selenide, water dikinase